LVVEVQQGMETTVVIPVWGEEDEERLKLLRLMKYHEQVMNALYHTELWIRRPYREIRDHLDSLLRQLTASKEASYSAYMPAVRLGEIPPNPHPVPPLPERDIEVISGLNVQVSEDKIVVSAGKIKVRGMEVNVEETVLDKPEPPFKVVVTGTGEVLAVREAAGLVYTLLEVDR
jgi:hypothetical protein